MVSMSEPSVHDILPTYDKLSFMSGAVMAYSEAIGFGVKQLGLSSLYSEEELEIMLKVINFASEKYGTFLYVEPDLLKSKLFQRDIAEGKTVVVMANNQKVLDEYMTLKRLKEESNRKGMSEESELEIAKRFGNLLSYDNKTIERLIAKNG